MNRYQASARLSGGKSKETLSETNYRSAASSSLKSASTKEYKPTYGSSTFLTLLQTRRIDTESTLPALMTLARHFGIFTQTPRSDAPRNPADGSASSTTGTRFNSSDAIDQIFLDPSPARLNQICNEYKAMHDRSMNEAEHAQTAREYLLKSTVKAAGFPSDRELSAERLIEFVCKPNKTKSIFLVPPAFEPEAPGVKFDWNVRPDCSYWISLQGFNTNYREKVAEVTQVVYEWLLCPYLSVEFKKDGDQEIAATRQVAVAAALALYNRWRLKNEGIHQANRRWDERARSITRHYCMIFTKGVCRLDCMWARLDELGQWQGCYMKPLAKFNCRAEASVRELMKWINAIHHWGIYEHGKDCQEDIKRIIHSYTGDTSFVESQSDGDEAIAEE